MGIEDLGQWIVTTINQLGDYIKPWVVVNHFQECIILRWGRYYKTLKPGVYYKWMIADYPLWDNVKPDTMEIDPVTVTTRDGKQVTIGAVIQYEISNLYKFLVENNDSRSNMNHLAGAEISDCLEDREWQDIKKKPTKNAVQKNLTPLFEDMGVKILDLKFKDKAEVRSFKFFNMERKNINAI